MQNTEELKNDIEELKKTLENKTKDFDELKKDFEAFKEEYKIHNHSNKDGTQKLRDSIDINPEVISKFGLGAIGGVSINTKGSVSEQIQLSISSGKDLDGGFANISNNLQFNLLHQPQNTSNQSFITAFRPPLYSAVSGSSVSTTAAGNTVTINGYNFTTNALANALINIFDSSGVFVETRVIASNTGTVITINGTWGASTASGRFMIYQPVFFGSADTIYQRFYTQEGTGGGIRFGVGVTAGTYNQNGLLYMDSTGDLYWRNKSGTSTKLN